MPTRRAAPAKAKAKSKKGLAPQTSRGLTKKRIEKKSMGSGKRVGFSKDSPTVTVQFLQGPDDFTEFEIHSFQEDGRWWFVPCAGDGCPLCDSDSEALRRTSYRFAANVWNAALGKVQVLEGPKTMALQIFNRYKRKPSVFLKRVFDVTKFDTQPVSYQFDLAEEDPVSLRGKKPHDLDEYLIEEMKAYYGDDLALAAATLDDDDDLEEEDEDDIEDEEDEDEEDDTEDSDEDEEEEDEEEEDEEEDDEDTEDDEEEDDEEDEEEDDDEDDEDDDDEPPARARAASKRAATAKRAAPAKKAAKATKKAPAKRAAKRR